MRTARLAASLVFAVGCSSGGSAGPQGTTDAGEAAAADAPSADAPTTEAGPEAGPPNLFIAWTGMYSTGVLNLLFANFSAAAGTRCATQSIAPSCYVIDCTAPGPVPAALSSGKLELYDGANVLLSATPDAQGIYPSTSSTTALWKAGDSIGLRTAGDALPMFDVPLTAPPAITLTAPLADGGVLQLDHTQSLPVAWTGAAAKVIVAASQTPAGATDLTSSARIICEFDGTTGSATVPAAAMAALSPSFTGTTALNVGGGVTQDKVLGSQPLHVYAINAQTQVVTVK